MENKKCDDIILIIRYYSHHNNSYVIMCDNIYNNGNLTSIIYLDIKDDIF